jgi:Zn-dependent alcohol dehydrogenase
MGHEAIGIVEDVGAEVHKVKKGDFVVMPFAYSDGDCAFCHEGLTTSCLSRLVLRLPILMATSFHLLVRSSPRAILARSRSADNLRGSRFMLNALEQDV